MKYINFEKLIENKSELKKEFNSKKPFRYIQIENFFKDEYIEEIHDSYPEIVDGKWDGKTYLDQKNKFQKTKFEKDSLFDLVFGELNSSDFLNWLSELMEIETELIADPELFGGGLHQSINGAFLNIHVDYNFHPTTNYHRRLNVIVYMNKDWKDSFGGELELWDLSGGKKKLLTKIAPTINRCVIFETNEISFHGHPNVIKTPPNINRKSIATYYYSKTRPSNEIASTHNTIYVNTQGLKGNLKKISSGVKAILERVKK